MNWNSLVVVAVVVVVDDDDDAVAGDHVEHNLKGKGQSN